MCLGNLGYNFGMGLKYLFMLSFAHTNVQPIELGLNAFFTRPDLK